MNRCENICNYTGLRCGQTVRGFTYLCDECKRPEDSTQPAKTALEYVDDYGLDAEQYDTEPATDTVTWETRNLADLVFKSGGALEISRNQYDSVINAICEQIKRDEAEYTRVIVDAIFPPYSVEGDPDQ